MSEHGCELNLLLVEDNDDHADLAEFYINEYDEKIAVSRLHDGGEAMEYLDDLEASNQMPPCLVLLDLKMPKYDGHEVFKRLRTIEKFNATPVIVFSTSSSDNDLSEALNNHVNSYVVKPMAPDQYGKTIHDILHYWNIDEHRHRCNEKQTVSK